MKWGFFIHIFIYCTKVTFNLCLLQQIVAGLIFATVVFFADLYFMIKQIS